MIDRIFAPEANVSMPRANFQQSGSGGEDGWDRAFDALSPYSNARPDVAPLVAMLETGKPVPSDIARHLAGYLNGFTADVLGYGLVVKKFPKRGPKLQKAFDFIIYEEIKQANRAVKLEAAIASVKEQTGLSRAKLFQIWTVGRWVEKVLEEIDRSGRSPTYEASRKAVRQSTVSRKSRRPLFK
jgi:hypothetical protein